MENGGSDAASMPSDAVMTILLVVPTSPAFGVPEIRPELTSNAAQAGRPAMLNERRSPSASEEAGVKEYVVPTSTCLAGDPEIEGARLVALTRMVNDGNAAEDFPSLTTISIGPAKPASARVGVPLSDPVAVSNVAHVGLFWMANVRRSPSASSAVGWKA